MGKLSDNRGRFVRVTDGGSERYLETGWAVIDRKGKVWTDTIFPTADAATRSAEDCRVAAPWKVEKARRVLWWAVRPGNKVPTQHETMIVGNDAHERMR